LSPENRSPLLDSHRHPRNNRNDLSPELGNDGVQNSDRINRYGPGNTKRSCYRQRLSRVYIGIGAISSDANLDALIGKTTDFIGGYRVTCSRGDCDVICDG
jgi:hypothetical protein